MTNIRFDGAAEQQLTSVLMGRDLLKLVTGGRVIRWQMHKSKGGSRRGETTRVRAILVEAVRIDGKPRQQHVAVVASFIDGQLAGKRRRNGLRSMTMTTTAAGSKPHWHGACRH